MSGLKLTTQGWVPIEEIQPVTPKAKNSDCRTSEVLEVGSQWCSKCWRYKNPKDPCKHKSFLFRMIELPEGSKPAVLGKNYERI